MKKQLFITNGVSFSGKSTWALRNFAPNEIIESDQRKYDTERNGKDLITYLCELINLRTSSARNTKTLKKTDRLEWYMGIYNNSLEQIRADKTWRVIEYYPEPTTNTMESFLE